MAVSLVRKLSHIQRHSRKTEIPSIVLAVYLTLLVLLWFVSTSDEFLHWFLIPLAVCGVIIGQDTIDWVRGKLDIFDPVGIIGLIGFHFFFLTALLHVHWDNWLLYIVPPADWREWLGLWAIINVAGLLVYRASRSIVPSPREQPPGYVSWYVNKRWFYIVGAGLLLLSAVLQVRVYASYGGIVGYINAATDLSNENSNDQMQGMGMLFMISESFPILALMVFAVFARGKENFRAWWVIIAALFVYLVLMLFFGGLRGSRSNTVWGLFWGVGIIHFWVRPFNRKLIYSGVVFLVFFMYVYGFFKGGGLEGLQAAADAEARAEFQEESDRGLETLLLGDLGRTDVQAFLLHRILRPDSDYPLAMGQSYVAALSIAIPRSIMERPPGKSFYGTEALFGRGSYDAEDWVSSKVYGVSGEALLNFGPWAMPFAFVTLGVSVGLVRRFLNMMDDNDIRLLLLPYLVNVCFMWLTSDMDNMIFNTAKGMLMPLALTFLGSTRVMNVPMFLWRKQTP